VQPLRPDAQVPELLAGGADDRAANGYGGRSVSQPKRGPVSVGDELHLRDEDYRYGVGPLRLRVSKMHEIQTLQDGAWLRVAGTVLSKDSQPLGEREALVRLASVGLWLKKRATEQ